MASLLVTIGRRKFRQDVEFFLSQTLLISANLNHTICDLLNDGLVVEVDIIVRELREMFFEDIEEYPDTVTPMTPEGDPVKRATLIAEVQRNRYAVEWFWKKLLNKYGGVRTLDKLLDRYEIEFT